MKQMSNITSRYSSRALEAFYLLFKPDNSNKIHVCIQGHFDTDIKGISCLFSQLAYRNVIFILWKEQKDNFAACNIF